MAQAAAQTAILAADLTVGSERTPISSAVSKGLVISQNRHPELQYKEGSASALWFLLCGTDTMPSNVNVPDVVGMAPGRGRVGP